MSTKRNVANPMFSRPLTLTETTKIPKQRQETRQVVCSKCNQPGGTLVRIETREGNYYIHQRGHGCNI